MRINFAALAAMVLFVIAPSAFADAAADAFASAEAKYQHGQYKEALAEYRAFQEKFPGDWRVEQAQFTAAFILQKKIKDSSQATVAYRAVAERKSNNAQMVWMAKYHLARSYEQAGDIPTAIVMLEDLRGKTPEHAREREINKRLRFLRRAAKDDPELLGWGYGLKGKKWRKGKVAGTADF